MENSKTSLSSQDPMKNIPGVDEVWKLVAEEGRSARNLLAWNVPINTGSAPGDMKTKSTLHSPKSPVGKSPRESSSRFKCETRLKARIRSASAGRDPKLDLRARYWAFLFENLRRAVDELYNTCEANENIAECKEVVMILENFTKDFNALIEWIKLKNDYENTSPPNRPLSLAWEVRKTSPVKIQPFIEFNSSVNTNAVRCLNFEAVFTGSQKIAGMEPEYSKGNEKNPLESGSPPEQSATVCEKCSKCQTSSVSKVAVKSADAVGSLSAFPKSSNLKSVGVHTVDGDKIKPVPDSLPCQEQISKVKLSPEKTKSKLNVKQNHKSTSSKTIESNFTNHKPVISTYHTSHSSSLSLSTINNSTQNENPKNGSSSSLSSTSSSSRSWAEKVKGPSSQTVAIAPSEEEDDLGGWETVQRNKFKSRNSSPPKPVKSSRYYKNESGSQLKTKSRGVESASDSNRICRSRSDEKLNSTCNLMPSSQLQNTTTESCSKNSDGVSVFPNGNCKRSCSYPNFQEMKVQTQTHQTCDLKKNYVVKKDYCKVSREILQTMNEKTKSNNKHYKNVTNAFKIKRSVLVTKDSLKTKESSCLGNVNSQSQISDTSSLSVHSYETDTNSSCVPSLKELSLRQLDYFDKDQDFFSKFADSKGKLNLESLHDVHSLCREGDSDSANDDSNSSREKNDDLSNSAEDHEEKQTFASEVPASSPTDWHAIHHETEERLAQHLADMTWGDRMDRIEAELRLPGRALQMHEKLSSPSRKRSLSETIRRHEEKQAKAQEQRERLLEEKAQKFREASKKVEEVRVWKEELLNHRRILMENRLQRAEEKRRRQLQMIVKKAHDEEEKVNEIAFINTLEAQNKRHDVLTRIQGFEARLLDLQEERQRRQEEKAAKEAAAEERRRALEAERQARLMEIQERRKLKEHKIEQQQQEKEKERIEQAREKARDREERLSALHAAQQANVEELQKKIQQKQEESARRHEENIEHIRQKALELSILRFSSTNDDAPKLVPYDKKKLCSLCNVLIDSEVYLLSHLRGKKHQQAIKDKHEGNEPSREELEMYNLQHIYDAPADKLDPQLALEKERQKIMKKRCKKLRQRITARGFEYEKSVKANPVELSFKGRMVKNIKEINRICQHLNADSLPSNFATNLDRTLNEIAKLLEKQKTDDLDQFRIHDGFSIVGQLLVRNNSASERRGTAPLSTKCFENACNVYYLACVSSHDNCRFVTSSNRIGELVEMFTQLLNRFVLATRSVKCAEPRVNSTAVAVARLLTTVLASLVARPPTHDGQPSSARLHDVVSYIVSVGIVDKLSAYFNSIRGVIDREPAVCDFIVWSVRLIASLARLLAYRRKDPFGSGSEEKEQKEEDEDDDPTHLLSALRATDLVGTLPLLYGVLLHNGAQARGESPPPELATGTLSVTTSSLRMLNQIALLDLRLFQGVLSDEGLSLEYRHIASYLLWYCSLWPQHTDLLHELVLSIGYFTVLHADNQGMIHSGHPPTVLQQLCSLPFQYFSRPNLVRVLFPTLIACCYDCQQNRAIVEQDMSCQLLLDYLKSEEETEPKESRDDTSGDEGVGRWRLSVRFPRTKWEDAGRFFARPSTPTPSAR